MYDVMKAFLTQKTPPLITASAKGEIGPITLVLQEGTKERKDQTSIWQSVSKLLIDLYTVTLCRRNCSTII